MTDDLANALAASSLLLTVLALLYTVWSGDISTAVGTTFATDTNAREPDRKKVRAVRISKAVPLMLGAWLVFLVFGPRALAIASEWGVLVGRSGAHFDDIKAALVLTEVFTLVLALTLSGRVGALTGTLKRSHQA